MVRTTAERTKVRALFTELMRQPHRMFPELRQRLDAPSDRGVYLIRDRRGNAEHVGRSTSGKDGLRQRLRDHLYGRSSYTSQRFKGDGSKLRRGYTFQCLVVRDERLRALLEAYTIGELCPAHIGLGGAARTRRR